MPVFKKQPEAFLKGINKARVQKLTPILPWCIASSSTFGTLKGLLCIVTGYKLVCFTLLGM